MFLGTVSTRVEFPVGRLLHITHKSFIGATILHTFVLKYIGNQKGEKMDLGLHSAGIGDPQREWQLQVPEEL